MVATRSSVTLANRAAAAIQAEQAIAQGGNRALKKALGIAPRPRVRRAGVPRGKCADERRKIAALERLVQQLTGVQQPRQVPVIKLRKPGRTALSKKQVRAKHKLEMQLLRRQLDLVPVPPPLPPRVPGAPAKKKVSYDNVVRELQNVQRRRGLVV